MNLQSFKSNESSKTLSSKCFMKLWPNNATSSCNVWVLVVRGGGGGEEGNVQSATGVEGWGEGDVVQSAAG